MSVGARGSNVECNLSAPTRRDKNPVAGLCRRHGLMGKRSHEKFVPDEIFALDEEQIARFLGVLFACDGYVHATGRLRHIGYTTISERLARDVQHLLLRLGIVATIRTLPRAVYEGTGKAAREVRITDQASLGAFCELIHVIGKREAQDRVLAELGLLNRKTNADTLPAAVWDRVLAAKGDRTWASVSQASGFPSNHNWHVGTRGLSRPRLGGLAAVLDNEPLHHLATSDLWWDEIVSIEPAGDVETFDLTVPVHHNFVADDIVVHNSALVTNIAENASIEHNRAVALFSLEMSETELAQRFVASQGRIFGDKLRKGRVPESEWPKILEASQKLARAPLYVDDSSDIGILDIRAKARRLHAQAPGGLGLIIVDYLQLMRPEAGTDNRVEQVGQMSRGLKILARELRVPVIALSQLSRAVEQRHDKKPILSDLRECVTGETPVVLADGRRVPIRELVGTEPEVVAVDDRDRLVTARSDKVWPVGRKPVFAVRLASGRVLRATAEHRIRCGAGWREIREIGRGDEVAVAEPSALAAITGDGMGRRNAMEGGTAVLAPTPTRTESEVVWDRVVAVQPDGEEEVYDLTVPGPACWLADGIVSHNSGQIEQDADLVMFIYRDEYYLKDESEEQGLAEVLIAKHRNGGLGDVTLTFRKEYPKFLNYAGDRYQQ